jgi:hypothetical protein
MAATTELSVKLISPTAHYQSGLESDRCTHSFFLNSRAEFAFAIT